MLYKSTEQTVGWFKDRYVAEDLEIRPPYQRRPVWTVKQKSNLIESILMGLPIPEIYIHVTTSAQGKTNYAVVDGQQRIRSILQFIGVEQEEGEKEYNRFGLEYLEPTSSWRGVTFEDLTDEQKRTFFGHSLAVRLLSNATEPEVRDMFKRLNKYLTKLSDQEIRNAVYSGPFVSLVSALADDDYWAENRIVSPAVIRRMGDIEFVSELVIGVMYGPQGGSGGIIDEYYRQFEPHRDEFPGQKEAKRIYDKTLSMVQEVLPEIKATRWGNRTDFYTLFVAVAQLLRECTLPTAQVAPMKRALLQFADQVNKRLANERARVPREAIEYVRAVEKGSSDKARRAARHNAVLATIGRHFRSKVS